MQVPEFLESRAAELMAVEFDGADKRRNWVVVLGLTPRLDGDQFCFLWGKDLQSGVAGFGATPREAMLAFDSAMYAKAPACHGTGTKEVADASS